MCEIDVSEFLNGALANVNSYLVVGEEEAVLARVAQLDAVAERHVADAVPSYACTYACMCAGFRRRDA